MSSFPLFVLYMFTFLGFATAGDDVHCIKDAGNFTQNGTYVQNRDHILSSLASNVLKNDGFYYNTTFGQGPDKVYALALCRADVPSGNCSLSIKNAVDVINSRCPNQKEVTSWIGDPPCLVRYANRNIFGVLEKGPADLGYNTGDISSGMTDFDRIWGNLMDDVIKRVSSGTTRLKFSHGEANLTRFQTIYTIMQCTPDLSGQDCSACLREAVGSYQKCCYGKQGGYALYPNCFWRWDLYPFYASPLPSITPSPPPPTMSSPGPSPIVSTKGKHIFVDYN